MQLESKIFRILECISSELLSFYEEICPEIAVHAAKNEDLGPAEKTSQAFMTRSDFEDILDNKLVSLKEDLATKDDTKNL